ncbi:MAG: LacI family DNA-binding transcriptional regulator [Chloroflexi bacterium]|nr:LacI family DNA-binding transcriptional regulator [Chloroflexota bacterium]
MTTPTLKDVADHAQVSRATVSRVLNNNPSVDEDLRVRVLESIRLLGYQPNRAARRLRASSSDVLGLIISDIENPFFISVVRGVEDSAYANHMSVVLCNTDEDPVKQRMYLSVMQAERVAGLIISPTNANEDFAELRQVGIPIILLDRRTDKFETDAVSIDNVGGAYLAVKHLIDLGYERIGMIGGSPHLTTGRERYEGYRKALHAAGMKIDEKLIKVGNFKTESGYALAKEFITSPQPPRAIFVANNLMTLGTLRVLREHGVRVPQDIALVGFDDMPWSSELCPPLTAVSQPTYELGQETVQLLLRRLADSDAPIRTVTLQPRLVIRESCGAVLQSRS